MVSITDDLAALGIELKPVHGPRTASPLIGVVVRAEAAPELAVAATIASLLTSAAQDFTVHVVGASAASTPRVRSWVGADARFHWLPTAAPPAATTYTLVLPAGTRVGTYALEAYVDAIRLTGASCVRALVDGQSASAELWDTAILARLQATGDPEAAVRTSGTERWVAGNSLGLHDYLRPAPRLHVRKGPAGRHDLTVVVRDAGDAGVRRDYEERIRDLESRLARSEKARRRMEAGVLPKRRAARVYAALRRGPAHVTGRAVTMLRRTRSS